MAYEKQTFTDGETKLSATHLEHIEDGIFEADERITALEERLSNLSTYSGEVEVV